MSTILPDGTVIPSYLAAVAMGERLSANAFDNFVLRQGEVREIVYPDDKRSISKTVVEYSVVVQYRDGSGPATSVNYPNCVSLNLFGGGADKVRYTYRAQSKDPEKKKVISDGSKVLVLCVNGELRRAIIVGGYNEDKTAEKKDDGHNYSWIFNGVSQVVNKDGEYTLKFIGKTKIDGTLDDNASKDNSGSMLFFDKDGGVKLVDGGKNEEGLIFSLKDNSAKLFAKKTVEVDGPDGVTVKTDKSIDLVADKVHIGDTGTSEALVLGSTYRDGESSMNSDLGDGFQDLAQQAGEIATSLGTIGGLLTSGGSSMSAGLPGNIAAGPQIGSAGSQVISLASTFGQMASSLAKMVAAIKKFEAQAQKYLSQHHTTES